MKPARKPVKYPAPAKWSSMAGGEHYQAALNQQIQPWLSKIFGFHLLKIGNLSAELDTSECAISHQVNVAPDGEGIQVQADPLHLPFAERSIDACLLAHTLCWCEDPHRQLREIDRVLIDDGWLILTSFNPISILGPGKLLPWRRKHAPWNSRMFTLMRQLDWLALLNFEVMHRSKFQIMPWRNQGGKILNTHLPALGCLQLIVARKRTVPLTLTPQVRRAMSTRLRPIVGATSQSTMLSQEDSRHPRSQD